MIGELIEAACRVREKAYAPYSHFAVGAALLAKDGTIYVGCNVENASYGMTICAERGAVMQAVAHGVTEFEALAVVTDLPDPASPCGACRQVLAEFAPQLKVYLANVQGKVVESSISKLLPHAFTPQSLREDNAHDGSFCK